MLLGALDGDVEGSTDGVLLGIVEGNSDGLALGLSLEGCIVGRELGSVEGCLLG